MFCVPPRPLPSNSYVASHYIYKYGIKATQVDFFHFMSQFKNPKTTSVPVPAS